MKYPTHKIIAMSLKRKWWIKWWKYRASFATKTSRTTQSNKKKILQRFGTKKDVKGETKVNAKIIKQFA